MKTLNLCFILGIGMLTILPVSAQTGLHISSGSSLTIKSGETISADGIWLTPSADFTISNNQLTKETSLTNAGPTPYMSRSYLWASTSSAYSGSIGIQYNDGELNGLLEPDLRLNIYDGTSWASYANNTNDGVANTVLTTSLTNVSLRELVLANALGTLPLVWGPVKASREDQRVKINWITFQETEVSHFAVQRSINGSQWTTLRSDISARNLPIEQTYTEWDLQPYSGRTWYRILQVDRDGRARFSPVVMVGPENFELGLQLYPNPVQNSFRLNRNTGLLSLQLYNSMGVQVGVWKTAQDTYDISGLPAGAYTLEWLDQSGLPSRVSFIKVK